VVRALTPLLNRQIVHEGAGTTLPPLAATPDDRQRRGLATVTAAAPHRCHTPLLSDCA
jgi:hypothetical protein